MPERLVPPDLPMVLNGILERLRKVERISFPLAEEGQASGNEIGSSAAKEYATFVIAASNTHDSGKENADFVCAGTDDQELINTALATGGAKRIVLLEGTYNLSTAISVPADTHGIYFMGMGKQATKLLCTSGGLTFEGDGTFTNPANKFTLAHLTLDGPAGTGVGVQLGGDSTVGAHGFKVLDVEFIDFATGIATRGTRNVTVQECLFTSATGIGSTGNTESLKVLNSSFAGTTGIDARATQSYFANNYFSSSSTGIAFTLAGADLKDADDSIISGNVFWSCTTPLNIRAPLVSITGNAFQDCGAVLLNAFGLAFVGNNIRNPKENHYAIDITTNGVVASGNTIKRDGDSASTLSGIRVANVDVVVASNGISEISQHGIFLDGADRCSIFGNSIIAPSQATANSYDGIHLANDANDNNVQGNKVFWGAGNQMRYGINVSSSTEDTNVVTNNDLKGSGATGSFNDAGTGTVTTAGNRL